MGSGFSVSVTGTGAILANLGDLSPKFARQVGRAIQKEAKFCFKESQSECPVGQGAYHVSHQGGGTHVEWDHTPGTLKGSGQLNQIDEMTWEVSYGGPSDTGEECDYQWYVELGTHKMGAQPFLYPAFLYASQLLLIDCQTITTLQDIESS